MKSSSTKSSSQTIHSVPLPRLAAARYTARLALDGQAREQVYRLRYRAYLAQGYLTANQYGLFADPYDELPNTASILIESEGRPVASIRTCGIALGSGQSSAATDLYPHEVNELLTAVPEIGFGQRGMEVNRMVRSPECNNNQGLVFLLYRMAGYVAMMSHAQIIFACVRSHHVSFYKRLGYRPAGEPRPYPGLTCDMQLLYCPRDTYDRIRAAYPVVDPFTAATGSLDGFLSGSPAQLTIAGG